MAENRLCRPKDEMIAHFDSMSSQWETNVTGMTHRVAESVVTRSRGFCGSSLLDVGAGTGILLRFLATQALENYTGLEISRGMIREFRKHHPQHRIVHGDIEADSTLHGEFFETIIIYNTFPLFRSPDAAVRTCRRLLRPGGALIVAQGRTRATLTEIHDAEDVSGRGYVLPTDKELGALCEARGFRTAILDDRDYFYLVLVADSPEQPRTRGSAEISERYLPIGAPMGVRPVSEPRHFG